MGRGGKKSDSYCRRNEAEMYSGLSHMGKKEERLHAVEFQAQGCMHGRSHLISPVVSDVHAYKNIFQEQILHENKWHDNTNPSLAKSTSIHERLNIHSVTGCL